MKKRVLAALIALAMMISCIPAFAYSDVSIGVDETAVNLVTGLGIMEAESDAEDVFGVETPVTRGEFALSIVKMLNLDIVYGIKPAFTDVDSETDIGAAINYLAALGVLNGYNEAAFRPNDTIVYQEACRMIMNALGYGGVVASEGGYPLGYIKLAASKGINDNLSMTAMTQITKLDAAKLIYNALMAETLRATITGGDHSYATNGETLLEDRWDVYETDGIVLGSGETTMGSGMDMLDTQANVGGVVYDKGNTNIEDYVGYQLKVYYNDDEGIKTLVSFSDKRGKNTEVTIDVADISSISGTAIRYYDANDKERKASLKSSPIVIYNGQYYTNYTSVEALIKNIKEGSVRLLSNDGSNDYGVIFIDEYQHLLVERVDAKNNRIYFSNATDTLTSPLSLNEKDVPDVEFEIYDSENKEMAIADILADDAVTVRKSPDGKNFVLYVSRNAVEGTVSGVNYSNGDIIINGENYEMSAYADTTLTAGMEGAYVLTTNGKILGSIESKAVANNAVRYGYLMRMSGDVNEGVGYIKIFTEDKGVVTFTATGKVRVNGKRIEAENVCNDPGLSSHTLELISYKLNSQGQISELNRPYDVSANNPDYYSASSFIKNWHKGSVRYIGGIMGRSLVTEDTVIFNVPKFDRNRNEDYQIITIEDLSNKVYSDITAYDVDRNGRIGALLIKEDITDSVSKENPLFFVSEVNVAVNADGDIEYEVKGFESGEEKIIIFNEDTKSITYEDGWKNYADEPEFDLGYNKKNPAEFLNVGDALQYSENQLGKVNAYRLVYNNKDAIYTGSYLDYNNPDKYFEDWSKVGAVTKLDFYDNLYIALGDVQLRNNDFMAVLALNFDQREGYKNSGNKVSMMDYYRPMNLTTAYVYEYDVNKDELTLGDMESVSKKDTVFVRSRNMGVINEIMVYVEN